MVLLWFFLVRFSLPLMFGDKDDECTISNRRYYIYSRIFNKRRTRRLKGEQMSFMEIGGKTFICSKCEHRVNIDYEGGVQLTQVGELEIMNQEEILKELAKTYPKTLAGKLADKLFRLGGQAPFMDAAMNSQLRAERGFYLYDLSLCESCYKKSVPEALRAKSNKFDEVSVQLDKLYNNTFIEIEKYFAETLDHVTSVLTRNDIFEAIGGVDEESLKDKRQHKGKRKTPIETLIHNNKDKLEQHIINMVLTSPKIEPIIEHYKQESRKLLKEIQELSKSNSVLYASKTTDATENLNRHILTDATVRTPVKGSVSEDFYYEMEIDFPELRREYKIQWDDFYLQKETLEQLIEKILQKKEKTC